MCAAVVALVGMGRLADSADIPLQPKDTELPKLTMPEEFAMVFSFGYVNDFMPKDEQTFERVLGNMKRTGINTIHCKYFEWRQRLCEKHGVRMMIDLAVPEHDLKKAPLCSPDEVEPTADLSATAEKFAALKKELDTVNAEIATVEKELKLAPDKKELEGKRAAFVDRKQRLEKDKSLLIGANVKAICLKARNSKGVWGYGLWYDNGTSGAFLNHAVEKLRVWDPTHVTFVGSYRHAGLETVTINPGCYGWYDYHWQRGILWHYLDMKVLQELCARRNAIAGCYAGYSGFNQDLFTVNQCIASGVKMAIWFIGGPLSRDTYEWNDNHDLVRVAAEFRHMYGEIGQMGPCLAYYSTPVTRNHANQPLPAPVIPRWFQPFPPDHWARVVTGEAMMGFFQYPDGTDAFYLANHNAFAPQKMTLALKNTAGAQPLRIEQFDRKAGQWKPLATKHGMVSFELAPGGGELLRVTGRKPR